MTGNPVGPDDDAPIDLLSAVMGTGEDEVSRLIQQVQQDTLRAMNEEWGRRVVHGEHPCDCGTEVCVGVRFFAWSDLRCSVLFSPGLPRGLER